MAILTINKAVAYRIRLMASTHKSKHKKLVNENADKKTSISSVTKIQELKYRD